MRFSAAKKSKMLLASEAEVLPSVLICVGYFYAWQWMKTERIPFLSLASCLSSTAGAGRAFR